MKSKIALAVLCSLLLFGWGRAQTKQHSITLNWTAGSGDVTFNVYRGTVSGGPYLKLNSAPVTSPTYSDTTGLGSTKYYYVVSGVDSGGYESVYSNEASATFLALPGAPASLAAVAN
jgi:fibronectin type 3 domain-containing protein